MKKEQIQNLRKLGFTLQEIGDKLGITGERVRQLLIEKSFCKKHERKYIKTCKSCDMEYDEIIYKNILNILIKENLTVEINRLKEKSRKKDLMNQKRILIKILRDKYCLSFSHIARLLKRDRTSIKNLYDKVE